MSPGLESHAGPSGSDTARLAMVRARRMAVEKEILRLQTQAESTLRDLDSIDLDLRLAAHKLDEAELEFKQTSRLLDATIKDVQSTRQRIEVTRPRVLKSLAALSKLGELSYARLLFSLDDPADVLRGYRYVSRIASADSDRIKMFRASLTELSGLEDQLKKRTAESVETRRRLNQARGTLSSQKSSKQARFEEIARERALQEALAEEYRQREAELLRLLGESGEARLEKESAPPIAPFRGDIPLGNRKGDLVWPVRGSLVKKFGVERDPQFGTRTIQQGIEIDAFPEIEVHAVHQGRVVFADQFVGYGMLVIVDHGHREHTLYGRLGELKVAPGDDVVEGSLLGLLPNTRVTGSGLHFEVRVQGKPEDPLDWLKKP
ncbi:MAG: peptidoglycan DD-metalloendopeptidase family protein [Vicinamibacteria bacterium]|nr:peptidoglycan DD-metalloendopeptidase family protein [Vicinamibacteria bacterium]